MSDYSLKVENLSKKYDDFLLDKVSFYVPKGNIVGFIGENGAGKSTTINTMLDIIERDSGDVYILDSEKNKIINSIRERIGVVFDGNNFPEDLTPQKLNNVLKAIYTNWEEKKFYEFIEKFNLPKNKKIKNFSRGMKMKLSISVALSHKAELLILDEATSGLDPIVRDDILDILLDFVQDEKNSILISSHITSDLEKVADYIVFIHKGKVIFEETKDNLIYNYGMMKCKTKEFDFIDKKDIIRFRKMDYGYEILVKNKNEMERKYPNFVMDNIKIEDIMLMYVKGEM
ncbi:MAG TPA: ABC transporter ATP-binding protein [Clostridiaceae bacterium]|nr:ABC transporter ATP-binding protein [Clostridiaceae bacterium]